MSKNKKKLTDKSYYLKKWKKLINKNKIIKTKILLLSEGMG